MNPTVIPTDPVACDASFATFSARDDLLLSAEVDRALRAKGYSALRGVDIVVKSGVVHLLGRVPNYHMKQLAQATAMRMAGVHDVCNEVVVTCSR